MSCGHGHEKKIEISLPPGQQDNSNALPLGQSDQSNTRPMPRLPPAGLTLIGALSSCEVRRLKRFISCNLAVTCK